MRSAAAKRWQILGLATVLLGVSSLYWRQNQDESSSVSGENSEANAPGAAGPSVGFAPSQGRRGPEDAPAPSTPLPGVDFGVQGLEDESAVELAEGLYSPPTYGLSNWLSLDQRLRRNLSQMLIDRARLEVLRGNTLKAKEAAREALDQVLTYSTPAVPSDLMPPLGIHGEKSPTKIAGGPALMPPPGKMPPPPGRDGAEQNAGSNGAQPLAGADQGGPRLGPPPGGGRGPDMVAAGGQAGGPAPGQGRTVIGPPGAQLGPPPGMEEGSPSDADARPFEERARRALSKGWFGAAGLCYASLWPGRELLEALPASMLSTPHGSVAAGMRELLAARRLKAEGKSAQAAQRASHAFDRLNSALDTLLKQLKEDETLAIVQGYHALAGDPLNVEYIWGWLSPDFALNRLQAYLQEAASLADHPGDMEARLSASISAVTQMNQQRRQPGAEGLPYWTTDRALGRVPT